MRIDLERALADVAATVHDDVTADRMSGQVWHMVTRVRRRRAVRHTAQGVAGIGAVAVIGVAATSLGGPLRGAEVAPATASPDATLPPAPLPALSCGSGVPGATAAPLALELGGAAGAERGASTTVAATLRNTDGADLELEGWRTFEVVAVADGRVVGTMAGAGSESGTLPADSVLRPGGAAEVTTTTGFASCDDPATTLPAGDYTLVGRLLVGVGDVDVAAVSEPVPVTVTGPEEGASELERALTLEALLAAAQETDGPFPVCGTKPWLDDGMPALELDYVAGAADLAVPATVLPGGVVLKTTEGRYAVANASPLARVVLLRDGVVVGVPFLDPEDLADVDLAAGETQPFDLMTTTALCGTGEGGSGEALPLPAGEYTAIAALDLMVKEIGGPGEEPDGRVVGTMAGGGSEGGTLPADGVLRPGDAAEATTTTGFASCDDPATTLPAGDYTLVGRLVVGVGDVDVAVVSAPVPFTVTGPEEGASALEPELALQALLAAAQETDGPFPVCGTKPWLDDGMPALELDYVAASADLAVPTTTLPGGVVLKTTEGRYAIANASPLARVVLLRDGVVVGVPFLDPEGLADVDLAAGETQPFDLMTTTALCGTGDGGTGEALPLPAGEYTAIAALDLMVKEIGGPGEEPDGRTYPYTAVSEPVTVTLP